MNTRHLVDKQLEPMLEMGALDINLETLPEIRAMREMLVEDAYDKRIEPVRMAAPGLNGAPDVPLLVFSPALPGKDRPCIVHLHGGGMVAGKADMARLTKPQLVIDHGAVLVSVDYRLAPETPFPGPQEDNYAAMAWVVANARKLGIDPARIVVLGESAGGGLAASLALMLRDRGGPQLAGQALIYPMLDYRTGGPDDLWRNKHTGEWIWNRKTNQFGWQCLRGDYGVDDSARAWFSPALAQDLSRLPPTYISTGSLDLFLDEDLDYARRLIDAGVSTELHVYPGAIHAFEMVPDTIVAVQAAMDLRRGLERLLAGG